MHLRIFINGHSRLYISRKKKQVPGIAKQVFCDAHSSVTGSGFYKENEILKKLLNFSY